MADLSNKELLLPFEVVVGMWHAKKYIPNLKDNTMIKTRVQGSNDTLIYKKLKELVIRLKGYL